MTDTPVLSARNLVKRYGGVTAVQDFSVDIRPGEFLTLLGPSGSGKSTVLSMIAGFSLPDGGSLHLQGQDITNWSPERRSFGMVYQGYALFPHMTVAENVAFGLRMRRRSRADIESRVASLLKRVRLDGFEDRLPRQLSGGQQQRVALARAIAFEPNLLLLDEPLSALDRQLRADVQRELRELNRDLGLTFIFVTHDQDEALSLSDRVAVMDAGKLVQIGSPADLYERPANRFIAGFLGESNFLDAVVEEKRDGRIWLRAGPWRFAALDHGSLSTGDVVTIAMRPERIVIATDDAENAVAGTIHSTTYLGSSVAVECDVDGIGLVAMRIPAWSGDTGGRPSLERGSSIRLSFPCAAMTVLAR
jgi:putative spermidine/putrescine transport system ATP-binding protein